jgi:hypothetical protein
MSERLEDHPSPGLKRREGEEEESRKSRAERAEQRGQPKGRRRAKMRDDVASGSSDAQARLRVAGAWAGKLEVPLDTWTVANLRVEIARLAGFGADSINMICAGRILKDDAAGGGVRSLREVGIADDSKILLTRSGVQQAAAVNSEKQRSDRLARIK